MPGTPDELLNANSAILNSLPMVLNERVFRRGREMRALPLVMVVGASNRLPEDDALGALFDRFLLRVRCDNAPSERLQDLLTAGWKLDLRQHAPATAFRVDDVRRLNALLAKTDLNPLRQAYVELVHRLRHAGMVVSDRRAVKRQRLMAASALLCGRLAAAERGPAAVGRLPGLVAGFRSGPGGFGQPAAMSRCARSAAVCPPCPNRQALLAASFCRGPGNRSGRVRLDTDCPSRRLCLGCLFAGFTLSGWLVAAGAARCRVWRLHDSAVSLMASLPCAGRKPVAVLRTTHLHEFALLWEDGAVRRYRMVP